MEKVKWWEPFVWDGLSHRERRLFNEQAAAVDGVAFDVDAVAARVDQVQWVIEQQQTQIAKLGAVIKVVVDALQAGELDGSALGYRIEAALDALEPVAEADSTQGTASEGRRDVEVPQPEARESCVVCGDEVLLSQTNLTESGPACDRCFAGL